MHNKFGLSEKVWQKAIEEVVESLRSELDVILTDSWNEETQIDFGDKAAGILSNRIALIQKENKGFLHRLKEAKVKSHETSLLQGHYKGLRHHLKVEPGGLSKDTSKQIVKELFDLKD